MVENDWETVKNDLLSKMEANGLTSPVYMAKLDDYMNFYVQCNKLVEDADHCDKVHDRLECLKEARQMEKSMLSILDWLGITPSKEGGDFDL